MKAEEMRIQLASAVEVKQTNAVLEIQRRVRGFLARCRIIHKVEAQEEALRKLQQQQEAATSIQCLLRSRKAKSQANHKRKEKVAAIRIQNKVRQLVARHRLHKLKIARKELIEKEKENNAASKIQTLARTRKFLLEAKTRRLELLHQQKEKEEQILRQHLRLLP